MRIDAMNHGQRIARLVFEDRTDRPAYRAWLR